MTRGPNLRFQYKGQMLTITELMEFSKVKRSCFESRLKGGWNIEAALSEKTGENTLKHSMSKNAVDIEVGKANKERKAKIHDVGPLPWLIGDLPLDIIPPVKKTPYKNYIAKHKKNIEKKCESCGASVLKSHAQLRDYKNSNIKCYDCLQKEKVDFNKAIINLAKNRGLIK